MQRHLRPSRGLLKPHNLPQSFDHLTIGSMQHADNCYSAGLWADDLSSLSETPAIFNAQVIAY
jgi:hypothetical protein